MAKSPFRNCLVVPHICSFGTSKHTGAIRESQNGRRWGATEQLPITLLQAAISIAGLGTILLASEGLFDIIKWIGASYLIYMGLSIWCSPNLAVSEKPSNHLSSKAPLRKMYIQAAFVTAGNPKAIIFLLLCFLSLLTLMLLIFRNLAC